LNKKITNQQRAFVEFYLQTWQAGNSAKRAGYKNPSVAATRLLQRKVITDLIDQRMNDESMITNEVLARLTQMARVNIGDFFVFDDPDPKTGAVSKVSINWDAVRACGFLIKRITWSGGFPGIELYDSQYALQLIAKARGMLTEKVERKISVVNINIVDHEKLGIEDVD